MTGFVFGRSRTGFFGGAAFFRAISSYSSSFRWSRICSHLMNVFNFLCARLSWARMYWGLLLRILAISATVKSSPKRKCTAMRSPMGNIATWRHRNSFSFMGIALSLSWVRSIMSRSTTSGAVKSTRSNDILCSRRRISVQAFWVTVMSQERRWSSFSKSMSL